MVSKEKCSFGVEDLPTPALIYSKKSGKILCWNKPARKLLGYSAKDKPSVSQWRPQQRKKTKPKKIDGDCLDLGVLPHTTKAGVERLVRVLEKPAVYKGEPCFVNWITDVTNYVQAEMAYANFYGAVTNASIVSMADKKGIITYVNQKFEKISGYSQKELIGKNHRIINSGHHPRKFWIEMWKTIASGKTWRAEVKNKAKDGSYYWVDTFVMPFLDENGKVEKYLSIRNDITDRKNHEDEITGLVRQLSEFNFAINSASIVSRADKKGVITYINDNFIRISGYKSEELIGQNHRIINSAFHPRSFWVNMWKTIASGQTWRAEVKNKAKDGSYYWVDTFVMPFLDEEGRVKEFLSIRNDITQRKSQEEQIISLNHSLIDFQSAITKSSIVSRADKRGIITYVNKNFVEISGYSVDELIGHNHNIINSGYHPKSFWTDMWKTIASGNIWRGEVKNRAKDGSYYWVDTFIMPFLDENRKVREFLSIRNDITSKKELREDLLKSNESLRDTLIFGKMGSVELDLKTLELTLSRELLQLLEEPSDASRQIPLEIFLKTYVNPSYLELIREKLATGMSGSGTERNVVEAEFEMITAHGKKMCITAKGIFRDTRAFGILHDISERREKEREIMVRDEREKLILSSTLDAIVGVSREGNIIQWNKQAEQIFGWTGEEVLGKEMSDLIIPPKYKKAHLLGMDRFRNYGTGMKFGKLRELEALHKNGTVFPIELTIVTIGEGKDQFLCSFIRDITQRKQAEQKIINEREYLNAIINSLPGIFYLFDEHGKFLKWNKNFEVVTKYSAAEIMSMTPLHFFKPEEQEPIGQRISKVFAEGAADIEANLLTKDDRVIPYYFNGFATTFEGNRCLIGMGQDLSDLRNAVAEKRKAEILREEILQEVINKNKQIENILFSVTDYFFAIDLKFNFLLVNPAFARLQESRVEDIVGKNMFELYPRLIGSYLAERYALCIESQEPIIFEFESTLKKEQYFKVNAFPNPEGLFVYFQDVTEEKKANKVIRKSQAELNAILNASRDAIIYLDEDAVVQVFNREAEKLLNKFGAKEIKVGIDLKSILPHALIFNFSNTFQKALDGEFVEVERESSLQNGSPIWTLVKYLPIKDEDSKLIIGISLTVSDITERKLAEIAIRESNERFKGLYNHTPAMMHSMNNQGYLVRVSDYWLQKMEYTREEVIGRKSVDFLTAESRKRAIEEVIPKFYKEGFLNNIEYDWVTKSGKILNTLLSANGEFDEKGNFVKSMAVITDITEKRKLEQEIEKLAFIAKHTSNAVIICDVDGRITWANDGFIRISEYTLEETLGKKPGEFLQGPETNPATIRYMSQCISSGIGFKEEVLNYSKSGKKYWLDIEVMPIRDDNNEVKGFMAIESDITQLKLAISEMLNSQSRLQTMMSNAPIGVFIKDLQSRYTFANDAFLDSFRSLKLTAGYTDFELFPKDVADRNRERDMEVISQGKPVSYEHTINDKHYYTVKFPIADFDGRIYSLGGMSIDITENKKAEREVLKVSWLYEFTSNINQMVIHAKSREEILQQACEIAITHGKFRMAWIGAVDLSNQNIKPIEWNGHEDGYLSSIPVISLLDEPTGRGPTGRAFREKIPVINNDVADREDKNFSLWRDEALKRGYRSSIGVPILINREVFGIFTLYNEEPNFFGENEVKLLKQVTDNISFGMSALAADADRREKNIELIESRDLFRSLVRDINIGILLQGPQSEIILANQSSGKLLGLTEDQLYGRSSFSPEWNVIHEDGSAFEGVDHPVPKAIQLKQAIRNVVMGVYRPITQDRVWLLVDAVPRLDEYGEVKNVICSFIDITQLKKAERITKESELRLRTILETEPECVKILNAEGRLMEMNKAGLEMVEAKDFEEVKGCDIVNLLHEPYRNDFKELTKAVFQGKTGMLEFKMTGLKGATRWLETHAVPMYDDERRIISLLGVTRDITQRKETERKLIESEERYRKLFELSPAPTWIYDINTLKFLNVNRTAVEHYGYSLDEFKEMTVYDIHPEEEKRRMKKAVDELQKKDYDAANHFPKLWKHKPKNGEVIDVEVMVTALDAENRSPRLVTINDVTEKLKVQSKLLKMIQEKEMLIREIHHRVKNNLQLVSSILYIRLSKMQMGEMKDFLSEMRQRIKSIAFLHERLLQSGSINHLEMADYLRKLISDIKLSIENKDLKLSINTDVERIWMDLDSAIYCGLIMNELITNSIKYAFKGKSEGVINVSLKKVNGKTEFIVADNGIGIQLPVEYNDPNSNFGMQLLDTFGKQLQAAVTIDNESGTRFKFVF